MVKAMKSLAGGNFEVSMPGRGRKDEIGAMAEAVELFKEKAMERARSEAEREEALKRLQADERKAEMQRLANDFEAAVGSVVQTVSRSASALESAAGTLKGNAETTQRLSSLVANASNEASENVQLAASAAKELANSVVEIQRQASESSRIAHEAVSQAQETDARIAQLSDAATRIGNVINLITSIAQQTNLLALNATIEAARAGDAGRGFAVVAAEVKSLATQTAKATDEISAQIGEMQSATKESVDSIKEISATIGRISGIAATIANAVEEQTATTSVIGENVGSAAESAEQAASNIADVNYAASETGAASSQVLDSARILSEEGNKFRVVVEKFLLTVRAA
jgi:methyl-accepting chemotaxis protein